MKIFISWSGERSRFLAEGLRRWLPGVINAAEPWISSSDIDPGSRWGPELARQLEQTKYGVLCITAENVTAPWILFEAGALSKYVEESKVVPLLLDIKPTDIQGPLTQFQSIRVTEKDINKLVVKINQAVFDAGEKGVDAAVLENSFHLWWPQLEDCIKNIPKTAPAIQKKERTEREMIEEVLGLVRRLENRVVGKVTLTASEVDELVRNLILAREKQVTAGFPPKINVAQTAINELFARYLGRVESDATVVPSPEPEDTDE